MNILAIGNSFSQDATRYLSQIAKTKRENINVASLYIGGCSLEKHFRNLLSDLKKYELLYNGENTNFYVSIKEALLNREWDIVTLQQQSLQSADYETFCPYLERLVSYIKKFCPKSKIYLHQTWGYENGSDKLKNTVYASHEEMFADIEKSYKKAGEVIQAEGIIPCGKLICNLHSKGFTVHRDGFHLSKGFGRFAAGLMWYKTLTGGDTRGISLYEYDVPIEKTELEALWKEVSEI